jgi:hypothetical protein
MIAYLRRLWHLHMSHDATPAENVCESCPDLLALHCTDEQAARCRLRPGVIESNPLKISSNLSSP